MARWHFTKRQYSIAGAVLSLFLLAFVVYRLLPPTQKDIDESAVIVEQQAYYQLEVNGKPTIYFADYKKSELIGGVINKESIRTRKVRTRGYWVNRFPILPSCFGRIVTKWGNKPSNILKLSSNALHKVLANELETADAELSGLQTQHNELGYYMRVHNVSDYGYNKVADYNRYVERQRDSLQTVIRVLQTIPTNAQLRVKQINRYTVLRTSSNKTPLVCNRLAIYEDNGNLLLQTAKRLTPIGITTLIGIDRAQEELAKVSQSTEMALNKPLQRGIPDSLGYYVGEIKQGKPNGYGQHFGNNGSFYDGHWNDGKPNGFGFYIAPHEYLQVGEWKEGVFKGERISHHHERIYGIDISKHQHEKGSKHFTIEWDKLRITDLGKISAKEIRGKVDYPIAFMYIKSTEGCTVLNSYYKDDYAQARKRNIRVGTYHFFSTTSAGSDQARYFLKSSLFCKGDLPPVLDVEPSDAQIEQMGGAEVMFKHIRDWLTVVYRATGVRPILYVSQMFTKRYLPLAIDLQGEYFVWIARYGEYKPELKLTYWQLSPDGRVQGIHGDVDINVFNGYKNQYEEFLRKHSIKKDIAVR